MLTPFLVHLVFHPRSAEARRTALDVHAALNDDPALPGLRVPTVVACEDGTGFPPTRHDLDEGEHSAVVVLADDAMVTEPDLVPAGRATWPDFVAELWRACVAGRHRFLPVQLSGAAHPLHPQLAQTSFLRAHRMTGERRVRELVRLLVVEMCRFLMGHERGTRLPVRVFISHAKQDAGAGSPFESVTDHLRATQPVDAWIDSAAIEVGGEFSTAIEAGVRDSDAVLVLATTHYSTRPWCRREVLFTKKYQRPMVVADCLQELDVRAFPYLGNAPVVAWGHGGAERAVDLLLKECLRRLVVERWLRRARSVDDVVFSSPPELATVIALPPGKNVIYPDPPLGDDELEVLAHTGRRVETPLQRSASRRVPRDCKVALSISEGDDLEQFGVLREHLRSALVEVSRHLLVHGASLAYGGHLGDEGYTRVLFDLVRAHQGMRGLPPAERVLNYVPWPLPLADKDRAAFAPYARFIRTSRPEGVELLEPATFVPQPTHFPASSPQRRYAWARGLTLMRERQAAETDARVVLGGMVGPTEKAMPDGSRELNWYSGRIPGVAEEAIATPRAGKALFLCGGFGGAAAMLATLIQGRQDARFTWKYQSAAPHSAGMRQLYEERGGWSDYLELTAYLQGLGMEGLVRQNALSEADNRELFVTRDVDRIIELVLTGLLKRA